MHNGVDKEEGMRILFLDTVDVKPSVLKELRDMMIVDVEEAGYSFETCMADTNHVMSDVRLLKQAHDDFVKLIEAKPPIANLVPNNASHARVIRIQLRNAGDHAQVNKSYPYLHTCMLETYANKHKRQRR